MIRIVLQKLLPIDVAANPRVTFLDLDMLVETGGRQRSVVDFAGLLSRHGLRLNRVVRRPKEPSILVAAVDP